MRVVSLLASGTEIVCGLGAGELLVGRSHECDNPTWVTALPSCSRPAFDVTASSGEIDAEVRRRLKAAEPLYHIDVDLIDALKPDLLITQAHCDVCAVTPDDVRREGCVVAEQVALQAGTVQEIYDGVVAVGHALDLDRAAAELVAAMKLRIDGAGNAVRDRRSPTVVALEWTDPAFIMGNWAPELIEAANGQLLLGEKGQYSKTISWRDVQDADPEVLIIAPCGFNLERTICEVPFLETLPGWFDLRAVRDKKVALADGNKYFNRSGTTIADTVEVLAEILHDRGAEHRGKAWQPYHELKAATTVPYLHAEACAKGLASYTDPKSGYEVFTADFLSRRGVCCGTGCRHCPYHSVSTASVTSATSNN